MASISKLPQDSVRHAQASPTTRSLIPSWELALEAADGSTFTIRSDTDSAKTFGSWLAANELPVAVAGFGPSTSERTSPTSANVHFRNLRVFWNWLVSGAERSAPSPMQGAERPTVTQSQKLPMDDAELTALLRTCRGGSFEDRRDLAMMRILIDNGMRVSSRWAPLRPRERGEDRACTRGRIHRTCGWVAADSVRAR